MTKSWAPDVLKGIGKGGVGSKTRRKKDSRGPVISYSQLLQKMYFEDERKLNDNLPLWKHVNTQRRTILRLLITVGNSINLIPIEIFCSL